MLSKFFTCRKTFTDTVSQDEGGRDNRIKSSLPPLGLACFVTQNEISDNQQRANSLSLIASLLQLRHGWARSSGRSEDTPQNRVIKE